MYMHMNGRSFHGYSYQKAKDRADSEMQSVCEARLPSIRATFSSLPVSLTAFGLRVLRIDDINMAFNTGNNVGISRYFKHILAPG